MTRTPLNQLMHPSWADAMEPVAEQIHAMGDFVQAEQQAGKIIRPEPARVLRAFSRPIFEVKVLVVGQDPYPGAHHAVGLSFSVERDLSPIPKSLQNIYTELESDLGIPRASHGDLSSWFEQGILLMNRVLTTTEGTAAAHRGKGWEAITQHAIDVLILRHRIYAQPLTAILWGRDAQTLEPALTAASIPVVASPHPSPLSAHRGFFGSRPFSRTNDLLEKQGTTPVDWRVK